MQELEKILEEIDNIYVDDIAGWGIECNLKDSANLPCDNCYECIKEACKNIIRKHMDNNNLHEKCSRRKWYQIGYKDGKNDGWIPVEERMPTKEECEKNQTGCIKFWITYGYRGNYSTLLANCKWVEADNEDGTTGDFAEFWVDQYPQIFYPSSNLIRGWKIIEAPDPYRPERGISIQQ